MQTEENRDRGQLFQGLVEQFLIRQGKQVENKGCWGFDIKYMTPNKEVKLEVKGISALVRTDNRTARFAFDVDTLPQGIDGVAFVISDLKLNVEPSVVFVQAKPVLDYVAKHKGIGQLVHVPLHQVRRWHTNGYQLDL